MVYSPFSQLPGLRLCDLGLELRDRRVDRPINRLVEANEVLDPRSPQRRPACQPHAHDGCAKHSVFTQDVLHIEPGGMASATVVLCGHVTWRQAALPHDFRYVSQDPTRLVTSLCAGEIYSRRDVLENISLERTEDGLLVRLNELRKSHRPILPKHRSACAEIV